MTAPTTKAARHAKLIELIAHERITSQAQLASMLGAAGLIVTQATLSRDLEEVGAEKLRGAEGQAARYVIAEDGQPNWLISERPSSRLRRLVAELLTGIDQASHTVVLRTPPGAAQYLASAFDRAGLGEVVGTIAGDDTIFVVARNESAACELVKSLEDMTSVPAQPTID